MQGWRIFQWAKLSYVVYIYSIKFLRCFCVYLIMYSSKSSLYLLHIVLYKSSSSSYYYYYQKKYIMIHSNPSTILTTKFKEQVSWNGGNFTMGSFTRSVKSYQYSTVVLTNALQHQPKEVDQRLVRASSTRRYGQLSSSQRWSNRTDGL